MPTNPAFISFYMPIRWLLPYVLAVLVAIEIVRIPFGGGFFFNTLLLFITLGLFGYGFSRLRHTMTAGVSPKSHALGGLIFGALWCLVVSLANTVSSLVAYYRDYYYASIDPYFVQVAGERQILDTNGIPYIVINGQITIAQFLINFAIHLACLAGVAAIGAMLGTIKARWNSIISIGVALFGVIAAYFCASIMYGVDLSVSAPLPGVFVFMVPLAALGALFTVVLIHSWHPGSTNLREKAAPTPTTTS